VNLLLIGIFTHGDFYVTVYAQGLVLLAENGPEYTSENSEHSLPFGTSFASSAALMLSLPLSPTDQ
jgi:hypothetical protein